MADTTSTAVPPVAPLLADHAQAAPDSLGLPATLRRRLNGQLDGRQVVAWSEFDLNSDNQYGQHYALLTDRELLVFDGKTESPKAESIGLGAIDEAKIVEGLGIDRLDVFASDKLAA